jgi:hypothetical protein
MIFLLSFYPCFYIFPENVAHTPRSPIILHFSLICKTCFSSCTNIGSFSLCSVSVLKQTKTSNVTILNPHVQLLGEEAASIAYIRVIQSIDK